MAGSIYEKNFKLFYSEATKSFKENELKKAQKLTVRALENARESGEKDWEEKFNLLHSDIKEKLLKSRIKDYLNKAKMNEESEDYDGAITFFQYAKDNFNDLFKLGKNNKKIPMEIKKIDRKIADLRKNLEIEQIVSEEEDRPREQEKIEYDIDYDPFYDRKIQVEDRDEKVNEPNFPNVVFDGSNIARYNQNSKHANINNIVLCRQKLIDFGFKKSEIVIILGSALWHYVDDSEKEVFESLLREDNVVQAPAGTDDDWFIINYANDNGAYIITNDQYKEYQENHSELKEFILDRCIRYSIIKESVYFEEGFPNKLTVPAKEKLHIDPPKSNVPKRVPTSRPTNLKKPQIPKLTAPMKRKEQSKKEVMNEQSQSEKAIEKGASDFDKTEEEVVKGIDNHDEIDEIVGTLMEGGIDRRTKIRREQDDLKSERLKQKELLRLQGEAKKRLEEEGYFVASDKVGYMRSRLAQLNLLGIKITDVDEYTKTLTLIPVKILDVKGEVIIEEDKVAYRPENSDIRGNEHINQILLQSNLSSMEKAETKIYNDLYESGVIFEIIQKYLHEKVAVQKSLSKKQLFLYSANTEYKVILNPVFVSNNEVHFSETALNFAYQRQKNYHFVYKNDFPAVLRFLEDKIRLIEENVETQNAIEVYNQNQNEFFAYIEKISLAFIIIGISAFLLMMFQLNNFGMVLSFSVGILTIYGSLITLFVVKYLQREKELSIEFHKPYHLRKIEISKNNLLEIYEYFIQENETLMNQFIYEAFGKEMDREIESFLSRFTSYPKNSKGKKGKSKKRPRVNEDSEVSVDFIENEVFNSKAIVKNVKRKFSNFLQD